MYTACVRPLKYGVDHSRAILPRPMGCCSTLRSFALLTVSKSSALSVANCSRMMFSIVSMKSHILEASGGSWGLGALGPAILWGPLQRVSTGGMGAPEAPPPQRGPWQSPGGKAFWQHYIENWLKIRYLNWSPFTPNSDPIATL